MSSGLGGVNLGGYFGWKKQPVLVRLGFYVLNFWFDKNRLKSVKLASNWLYTVNRSLIWFSWVESRKTCLTGQTRFEEKKRIRVKERHMERRRKYNYRASGECHLAIWCLFKCKLSEKFIHEFPFFKSLYIIILISILTLL